MDTYKAESELAVIRKIMEDSRNIVIDNGWHYILWGIVVSCALLANYFMYLFGVSMQAAGMMWFITMTSTAIAAGFVERKMKRKRSVRTFAGRLLGTLWFAGGISMFVFGFAGTISGAYNAVFICPIISTVLGTTYFVSGSIQQVKWLKLLSIGWWGGAIVLFLYPGLHTLMIFAVMLICFQIVPGIILNFKYKEGSLPAA